MNYKIIMTVCLLLSLCVGCKGQYKNDLKSSNVIAQLNAIGYAGNHKKRDAVSSLRDVLMSSYPQENKIQAVFALGEIKDESAIDLLIEVLEGSQGELKVKTAEALGKIQSNKAVPALISSLKNEEVRPTAIWALGNIDDESASPALAELLSDQDKYNRYLVRQSLKKIGFGG